MTTTAQHPDEKYKLTHYDNVQRLSDKAFIPFSIENCDYAEYLLWVADGNEPIEADPLPEPGRSLNERVLRFLLRMVQPHHSNDIQEQAELLRELDVLSHR